MVVDYVDTDFRTLKSNFFVKTKNGFGLYFYLKKEYIYVCQRLDTVHFTMILVAGSGPNGRASKHCHLMHCTRTNISRQLLIFSTSLK